MSKSKYVITGFPSSMNVQKTPSVSKTLKPVNRKIANVEAEKGETVVTNMSRGLNNIYEMYGIGGKKHSAGGTPLSLPTDTDDESGNSFIFSDSKKMLIKDKNILEYFGIKSNKPMTFADISKTFMSRVNDSKAILLDDNADKISKKSAEMTMDNTAFKIAALKLLQESRKGFKDGMPDKSSVFFEKLGLDPQEMFAINEDQANKTNGAVSAAFGGLIKTLKPFQSMALGGELNKYDGGGKVYKSSEIPAGAAINTTGKSFKVGEFVKQPDGTYLKVTKVNINPSPSANSKSGSGPINEWIAQSEENKLAAEKANAIIEKGLANNTLKKENGKIITTGKFKPDFEDRIILSRVLNQSGLDFRTDKYVMGTQKATEGYSHTKQGAYKGTGSFVAGFTPEDYEKRYIFEKAKGSGLTDDEAFSEVKNIYQDPGKKKELRKEYINFLGLAAPEKDDDLMSDDFYKKNYAAVTTGIENKLDAAGYRPKMGNEQMSGFEHFDAFGFTSSPEYEQGTTPPPANQTSEESLPPGVAQHLGVTQQLNQPYGFRREDINSLNRAVNARFSIPKLEAWSKTAAVTMPDRAYYSPERAIAAINEQYNQGMQGANAFGTAQASGATALALSGQAYGQVANVISSDADKNVGLFNSGEQYNTQLANARASQEAGNSTSMWDKDVALKQNFANSLSAAKDKITMLSNQAFQNASDIYNLNLNTENFKKDPFSGKIYKANNKAITPKRATDEDFAAEFNAFSSKLKNISPDLAMKAFMAKKSGKYVLEPTDSTTSPSDLAKSDSQG